MARSSDHRFLLLSHWLERNRRKGLRCSFKYEMVWGFDEGGKKIINEEWKKDEALEAT